MTSSYSFTEALRQAQQEARKELERRNITVSEPIIPQISISVEEWARLVERDEWLSALEAAGVDNWEGISYAREIYDEDHPDSEEN